MIDLLVARFEKAFSFFLFFGSVAAVVKRGRGERGRARAGDIHTESPAGLNRRDDHRVRPPTER